MAVRPGMRLDFDLYSDHDVAEKVAAIQSFGPQASKAVIRAVNRAVRKTARWLKGKLSRAVYEQLSLKRVGLLAQTKRITVKQRKGGQAWLWIGTSNMPAHYFRNPRWQRRWKGGARFTAKGQRQQVAGSFIARYGDEKQAVLVRSTDKAYPIKFVPVEVHEDMEEIIQRLIPQAREQFVRIARQELNYELMKLRVVSG
ncbi:hypothetical protein [Sulfurivirga sp.]|uniref:hypothetical protein n=1 Tax=Sulfurivirga sp. TaxID=2614236 RepID=UPI0025E1BB94|nr:hypothetical protein [Sulfurivirga sp.]